MRFTEACYSLGLRLMKYVYSLYKENEAALTGAATHTLRERYPALLETQAAQLANVLVFGLLKFTTVGVVRHVTNSIGVEKLSPVFAKVLKANRTVARELIDLSIRLEHFSAFPVDQTLHLQEAVQESPLALDVLRHLVFNRFYYFTAPHDIKQRICKKLEIRVQPALLDRDPKRDV